MTSSNLVNKSALASALDTNHLDALIAVSPKNVFYFSGSPIARTLLHDHLPHNPGSPYLSAVVVVGEGKNHLICPEDQEAVSREEAWVSAYQPYRPFGESPMNAVANALRACGLDQSRLGIEAEYLTVDYLNQLRQLIPGAQLIASDEEIEWIRSLKTPGEIALVKKSADLLDDALLEAFMAIRPGNTEWDFHSCVIESSMRRGAEYCRGFVAAGDNNDISFLGTGHKVIQPGDIIHTDYAAYLDGYPSNLSRLGVVGEPTMLQRKKYANLIAVRNRIVEFMRPGVTGKDVFLFARDACFELGYIHTAAILGHNLGLGYHDRPMLTEAETMPLEVSNHIALEPLLEWTFHIQDQVLVEEKGSRIISDKFNTRELFIVE